MAKEKPDVNFKAFATAIAMTLVFGSIGTAMSLLAVMGLGYIFSQLFPLTFFQASILAAGLGSAFVLGFALLSLTDQIRDFRRLIQYHLEDDDYDDDDEFDDDDYDTDYKPDTGKVTYLSDRKPPVRSEKNGRNAPCPCGSGKKYKFCCGKQEND